MLRPLAAGLLSLAVLAAILVTQSPSPTTPAATAAESAKPRYWKGNLHTHSFWSDGDDFPDMIADWYKSHGYHFLAMTEHNVIAEGDRWVDVQEMAVPKKKSLTPAVVKKYVDRFGDTWVERRTTSGSSQVRLKPFSEFRTKFDEAGKFLMIPAEEITATHDRRPLHMNGINLTTAIQPVTASSYSEALSLNLRQVAGQRTRAGRRMIGFLNHPNFGWGATAEDMIAAENLTTFEVFNGHPGVRNYGDAEHASTERMWDILLAHRLAKQQLPRVLGVATDDAHAYHQWGAGKTNPGRGWVMVRAAELNSETIMQALETGDFYCSSGVVLDDVSRVDNELRLKIRTEPGVTYTTEFVATMKGAKLDGTRKLGPDGKPAPITGTYSSDIGKVVATSTAASPSYKLTGNELYVRAKVTSSKVPENPYAPGDTEKAWTQPITP